MTASRALYDAPGPRAVVRNRIISAVTVVGIVVVVWFVVAKLQAKGQLTAEKWEPFTTADLWRTYILPGVQGTLTAAALSIVLAGLLGIMLGVGRLATNRWVRSVCGTAVEFFRAVPVLIMMIFAYFLFAKYDVLELLYLDRLYDVVYGAVDQIPWLSDYVANVFQPSRQLALAGVVTGLTLYNGAVIAEIARAGVNALPRGQSEAAAALGLRPSQAMRLILLPQAITAMLPALVSQLVVVLKDTAIGYQITFLEMVRQGTQVGAQYGKLPAGTDGDRGADDRGECDALMVGGATGAATPAAGAAALRHPSRGSSRWTWPARSLPNAAARSASSAHRRLQVVPRAVTKIACIAS